MTPFEEVGYTKDTKFKVLVDYWGLYRGDIVTLELDDGTISPKFKTEDGRDDWIYLPNMAPQGYPEDLEVYEEGK